MSVALSAPSFVSRSAWQRPLLEAPAGADGAASAPVTTETAAPSTTQDEGGDGSLSPREAQSFLKERRAARAKKEGLHLVQDETRLPSLKEAAKLEPDAAADDAQPEVDAGSDEETSDADGEQEPEKVPSWAQKLKTDVAKKTERITALERQHAALQKQAGAAQQKAKWDAEDLNLDLTAERAYSAQLEDAIKAAGFSVPADWKRAHLAEHRENKLKAQLARNQVVQTAHGSEAAVRAATSQVEKLREKLPELDWEKVPEAHAWLAERFAVDPKTKKPVNPDPLRNLERDAVAFAKALRWDRAQKTQKKPTPRAPGEAQRPTSTTLTGSGQGAGQRRTNAVPENEKESQQWLASRRAARK